MEYIKGLDYEIKYPVVLSIGKFDGLHRGHEKLMDAIFQKKKEGLKAAIFTFDMPPKKELEQKETAVLTTNCERMHLFEEIGIDYLIECPFTPEIMHMPAEAFLKMLVERFSAKCIVAGTDCSFGYQRKGDYKMLLDMAETLNYEAIVVEKMQYGDRDISSTYIREELLKGNMKLVNELLGYEYFIKGEVVHGNQIGRTIGIPTANVVPAADKLLPPFGVYLVDVQIENEKYYGIANIGKKPTIEGIYPVGVETFIYDFSKDIYGKQIKVSFLKRLRNEEKFANISELKAQMNKDLEIGRNFFANKRK